MLPKGKNHSGYSTFSFSKFVVVINFGRGTWVYYNGVCILEMPIHINTQSVGLYSTYDNLYVQ
jgi:hypothetical protein